MKLSLSDRVAVLARLIRALRDANSWCGETHIQKAVYILQNVCGLPLGYEYILYKHGPYSFGLSGDLGTMRGAGLTELAFPVAGYGPSIRLTDTAKQMLLDDRAGDMPDAVAQHIGTIVDWLGSKDVRSLERIATAYYVLQEDAALDPQHRAARLRKLKPHISEGEAISAVQELDDKLKSLGKPPC